MHPHRPTTDTGSRRADRQRLAGIRRRLLAASPHPWRWDHDQVELRSGDGDDGAVELTNLAAAPAADRQLVAHAPADLTWLLDLVERLDAQTQTLQEALNFTGVALLEELEGAE